MRSESQIFDLILSKANNDKRIRAVVLNGSRVNNKVEKDSLRDFDIVFFVKDIDSFKNSPDWIDVFGERIILQTPNSMILGDEDVGVNEEAIVYLMLFEDCNRIDLSLVRVEDRNNKNDSLTKVLLDKDNLFVGIQSPSDHDYWMKKPSEKQFKDSCNEFWWVSTYVVKGLLRNEIIYAKEIQETIVRKMFMNIIAWNVAAKYEFKVNLGAKNRFIKNNDFDI